MLDDLLIVGDGWIGARSKAIADGMLRPHLRPDPGKAPGQRRRRRLRA